MVRRLGEINMNNKEKVKIYKTQIERTDRGTFYMNRSTKETICLLVLSNKIVNPTEEELMKKENRRNR